MTAAKILVSIGAITIAGGFGVFFGWIEKKYHEQMERRFK